MCNLANTFSIYCTVYNTVHCIMYNVQCTHQINEFLVIPFKNFTFVGFLIVIEIFIISVLRKQMSTNGPFMMLQNHR